MTQKDLSAEAFSEQCNAFDLYDYAYPKPPRIGRRREDTDNIVVTDDWPDVVPTTEEEFRVLEAYFGDVLDEILGATL